MIELKFTGESIAEVKKQISNYYDEEIAKIEIGPVEATAPVEDNLPQKAQSSVPPQDQPKEEEAPTVDAQGFPWDSRIHSSSKKFKADGTWKRRKGVDDAVVKQVEQELAGKVREDAQSTTPEPPAASAQLQSEAPQQQPATIPMPQRQQQSGYTFDQFKGNLVTLLSQLTEEGKIHQDYIRQLCEYFGINQLYEIFNDDAKCKELYENFANIGLIEKAG